MWGQETNEDLAVKRAEIRREVAAYIVCFGVLFAGVLFLFWWSGTAVDFSAGRLTGSTEPTYRVTGIVRDERTGAPVPWAHVSDDPAGAPPFFQADGDAQGNFTLATVSLRHKIVISARGYHPRTYHVGRVWFQWWPHGEERLVAELTPEP